jgi:hypothetical protein
MSREDSKRAFGLKMLSKSVADQHGEAKVANIVAALKKAKRRHA